VSSPKFTDFRASSDCLSRFVVENCGVRGEHVRLGSSWRTLHERYEYAPAVRSLLGETVAAVALLSATIKFEGSLTLQSTGDGIVRLLVVEASGEQTYRGLARCRRDVPENAQVDELLGVGRIALTIDPGEGKDRYQGIVDFEGGPLAGVLENYFARSEQIPTRMWLAADGHRASGLLLQHLPGQDAPHIRLSEEAPDDYKEGWRRCVALADTVESAELLELPARTLLRRLFHREQVRVFEPEPWRFLCRCSPERVRTMLRALGKTEVDDVLAEQGQVNVTCDFCNAAYNFDAVDAEQIFAGGEAKAPGWQM